MAKAPSLQQMQLLAQLKDDAGYMTLLDILQAHLDDIADTLETASTDEAERRILNLWRAIRKLINILRFTPEQISQDLSRDIQSLTENQRNLMDIQRPPNFLRQVQSSGLYPTYDPLADWSPNT